MSKITQDTNWYKCDECIAVFQGKKVKLVEPAKNIILKPLHRSLMFVDKRGMIKEGGLKKGDRLLACPKCGQVHLFGFDSTNEVRERQVKNE